MVEQSEKFNGKRFPEKEGDSETNGFDSENDSNSDSSVAIENSDEIQKNFTEKPENIIAVTKRDQLQVVMQPHSQLPKPEAPPGLSLPSSISQKHDENDAVETFTVDMPAIGKFIRERSNNLSEAISKRFSSFKENSRGDDQKSSSDANEFRLSGLRVTVKLKNQEGEEEKEAMRGRISFFSRSNCRDCTAVRRFFREKGLKFVEINVDVFPPREKELIERTGSSSVPQIFFNEKLFGGLVALNSLRNSGGFDQRLKEMVGPKCPDDAPAPPVYGFDDHDEVEEPMDQIISIVRVLRQRLPIQDRLMKMKIVKNCFAGGEMVDAIVHHLNCDRNKVLLLHVT